MTAEREVKEEEEEEQRQSGLDAERKSSSSSVPPGPLLSKILVAVDGSENSKRALELAVRLSRAYHSKLIILNAVLIDNYGIQHSRFTDEDSKRIVDEALSLARTKLASESGGNTSVTGESKHATSIVETIVKTASDENADLIVLGTRGLGGFKKLVLGSVSGGVVTHADCNVLVVR